MVINAIKTIIEYCNSVRCDQCKIRDYCEACSNKSLPFHNLNYAKKKPMPSTPYKFDRNWWQCIIPK